MGLLINSILLTIASTQVWSLDLDVYNDGYWGVLLNSVTDLFCDFNVDSTEDFGDSLSIQWYDTNTGERKDSILKDAAATFLQDGFDISLPWVFFVGGFGTSPSSSSVASLRDALLTLTDHYIFVLDDSNFTSASLNILSDFENSVSNVFPIGSNVKNYFFDEMINAGVSPDKIQLIGHSLGAQVIARIGTLLTEEGIAIGKCTGLDPAGPCFSSGSNDVKLSSGDCKFVEVIHSNQGQLGTDDTVADFEAFANCAGKLQPHCASVGDSCYVATETLQAGAYTSGLGSICSHGYVVQVYSDSLTQNYEATPCEDYETYVDGECGGSVTRVVGFGSDSSVAYSGKYFFATEDCSCQLN